MQCPTINDQTDYRNVMNAMKTMGFAFKHAETLWKVVAAVLILVSLIEKKYQSIPIYYSSIVTALWLTESLKSIPGTSKVLSIEDKVACRKKGWPLKGFNSHFTNDNLVMFILLTTQPCCSSNITTLNFM